MGVGGRAKKQRQRQREGRREKDCITHILLVDDGSLAFFFRKEMHLRRLDDAAVAKEPPKMLYTQEVEAVLFFSCNIWSNDHSQEKENSELCGRIVQVEPGRCNCNIWP